MNKKSFYNCLSRTEICDVFLEKRYPDRRIADIYQTKNTIQDQPQTKSFRAMRNPKVYHLFHVIQPLRQINPPHVLTSYHFNVHFSNIPSSEPCTSTWQLRFWFSNHNFVQSSHLPHACSRPDPSDQPQFDDANNIPRSSFILCAEGRINYDKADELFFMCLDRFERRLNERGRADVMFETA